MTALPFELEPKEELIREEQVVWIQGGFKNRMGRLYLTNNRVLFSQQNPFLTSMFGLIGLLIQHFLKPKKPGLELPLKSIGGFERTTFGFNKNILLLHTTQGDLKFGLNTPYDQWEAVLKKDLKK